MENTTNRKMEICCGKCLITISRQKIVYTLGGVTVSASILAFLVCIIVLCLQTVINSDIQDILNHLNGTDLSDYELETSKTFWVSTLI